MMFSTDGLTRNQLIAHLIAAQNELAAAKKRIDELEDEIVGMGKEMHQMAEALGDVAGE